MTVASQKKLASESVADFIGMCEVSRRNRVLPRLISGNDLSLGVSGDADVEITVILVELGSFLKRAYLGALVSLVGHLGHFQMVVHLSLPCMGIRVQRNLEDRNQS